MSIEVTVTGKRVFVFKGVEYNTLEEFKAAAVTAALTAPGTADPLYTVDNILANAEKLVEILKYSGRKPRTPRPEGWVAPPKKAKRSKKAVKAEVAA